MAESKDDFSIYKKQHESSDSNATTKKYLMIFIGMSAVSLFFIYGLMNWDGTSSPNLSSESTTLKELQKEAGRWERVADTCLLETEGLDGALDLSDSEKLNYTFSFEIDELNNWTNSQVAEKMSCFSKEIYGVSILDTFTFSKVNYLTMSSMDEYAQFDYRLMKVPSDGQFSGYGAYTYVTNTNNKKMNEVRVVFFYRPILN